jgi:hypothetical protein
VSNSKQKSPRQQKDYSSRDGGVEFDVTLRLIASCSPIRNSKHYCRISSRLRTVAALVDWHLRASGVSSTICPNSLGRMKGDALHRLLIILISRDEVTSTWESTDHIAAQRPFAISPHCRRASPRLCIEGSRFVKQYLCFFTLLLPGEDATRQSRGGILAHARKSLSFLVLFPFRHR